MALCGLPICVPVLQPIVRGAASNVVLIAELIKCNPTVIIAAIVRVNESHALVNLYEVWADNQACVCKKMNLFLLNSI
jgi:hypothetical protein